MDKHNKKRPAVQKEKAGIIAAPVFVLSALTLAGVYMAERNKTNSQENRIDFAKLEQQSEQAQDNAAAKSTQDSDAASGNAGAGRQTADTSLAKTGIDTRFTREIDDLSDNNDMDVDPAYTEVNSAQVTNTPIEGTDKAAVFMGESNSSESAVSENEVTSENEIVADNEAAAPAELSFTDGETLQLPAVGNVLLEYSTDKAVYHGTMQQYRYNPSLVIEASEGEIITAAADGIVSNVYYDAQTGNTISFNLGDGYELTYGQLEDINLQVGDTVAAGDMVGKVAKPTIYYTDEGTNIYLKLTKDGAPVNPLDMAGGSGQ